MQDTYHFCDKKRRSRLEAGCGTMLRAGLGGEPTRKVRLAAVLYFISSSMLVQFTTKVCVEN